MPQKRSEKQIFQDVKLAVAAPLGGQWTDTNITRWLTRRGGVYTAEVTEETTHLICTVEEYKTKGVKVKQAAKLGASKCKIVTLDWLEDSLFKDRKQPAKNYLLNAVLKNERAKEAQEAKVAKGHELAERFVNTNLYHIYADATNFFYEITLTRDDTEAGWQGQKYILYLFESNATPHLYQFAAKFYQKPRDNAPKFFRPGDTPSTFWPEYVRFKSFFQKKTGIDWDERLVQISLDESLFQYKAPVGGKPVGYVPESGRRKPSTLKDVRQEGVEVKPEPGEGDIQFARLIAQAVQAEGGNEMGEEKEDKQPLTNDLTLAVAMEVDAMIQEEKGRVEAATETASYEPIQDSDAKADPDGSQHREAKQDATPPAQISAAQ